MNDADKISLRADFADAMGQLTLKLVEDVLDGPIRRVVGGAVQVAVTVPSDCVHNNRGMVGD